MSKKAGELLMANGKVVIDVILDDGSVVKGVANVNRTLGGMGDTASKSSIGIGRIASALGLVALASKGIHLVSDALGDAISRYDTLNRFPRVLKILGFDAQDSQKAIQELSDHIQGLPTALNDVAATTQRIALITGNLQVATKTTLALNDAFLASGSSTEDARRGLQQYVQMLSRGNVDMQSWRTLQETMPIALTKAANAFGFTGQSAQTDFYGALKSGKITFDQFNQELIKLDGGVGGLADLAKTSSKGIGTAFTNMHTAIVRGIANVLTSIDTLLKDNGLPDMEDLIADFGKKFESVLDNLAKNIPKIANGIMNLYNTFKPVLPLIKSVVTALGSFVLAFAAANTAIKIFNVTMSVLEGLFAVDNPFVFFAAATLVAVTLIIKYWKPITTFFINLWNDITASGTKAWDAIKSVTITAFNAVKNAIITAFNGVMSFFSTIGAFFSGIWDSITSVAITVWDAVVTAWNAVVNTLVTIFTPIVTFFSTIWTNIQTAASAAWDLIKNVILAPILLLIDLVTGDISGFKNDLAGIWNNIKNDAQAIWTALKNVVMTIVNAYVKIVKLEIQGLSTAIKAIWNGLKTAASATWNAIKTAFTVTINAIKTAAVATWNAIKSATSATWNGIKNTVINLVTGIKNGISNAWNTIKSATSKAWNAVVNFIKHPLQSINLKSTGKDIIQGLIDGIGSMVSAVGKKIVGVANSIKNGLRHVLGIHSPSTWMRDMIGQNMMLGWQIGIDRQKNKTLKKAQEATDWMTPNIPGVSGFVNRMRNMAGSIVNIPAPISSAVKSSGTPARTSLSAGAQSQAASSTPLPDTVILNIGGYQAEGLVQYLSNQQTLRINRINDFKG